ncbi:MAG: glycerol-3-phosphate acyltransferase, partial [Ruminococcus sp.]|nr:glycerol-3-phosphate acyltransferase [Ruminococcus sp.]
MEFLSLYWWRILASVVIAYLIGSFSFAVIFSKHSKEGKDVREMGSGNAG